MTFTLDYRKLKPGNDYVSLAEFMANMNVILTSFKNNDGSFFIAFIHTNRFFIKLNISATYASWWVKGCVFVTSSRGFTDYIKIWDGDSLLIFVNLGYKLFLYQISTNLAEQFQLKVIYTHKHSLSLTNFRIFHC